MTDKNLNYQVGKNVAYKRKQLGITQAQMAEYIKVEIETISRMENGKISLSLERLQQFSEILKCSPADFLRPIPKENDEIINALSDAIIPLQKDEQEYILKFVHDTSNFFIKKRK